MDALKILSISDTHNLHAKLTIEPCDLLIHAGDATGRGSHQEIQTFLDWFAAQPARFKIFVPGNHDWLAEREPGLTAQMCKERGIILLIDSLVEIEGLRIWGSPITPFFNAWAFNRFRGEEINKHWKLIPEGIDLLITHGPPKGILDRAFTPPTYAESVGCAELFDRVMELRPKAHIFGHIHSDPGVLEFNGIKFYNVSNCGDSYYIERPATLIEL